MIVYTKLKIIQFKYIDEFFYVFLVIYHWFFSVIYYDTLKLPKYCILKKVGFKIQPERFLNLFLIFGEKSSLVSYKLVSYKKKKKRVFLFFSSACYQVGKTHNKKTLTVKREKNKQKKPQPQNKKTFATSV